MPSAVKAPFVRNLEWGLPMHLTGHLLCLVSALLLSAGTATPLAAQASLQFDAELLPEEGGVRRWEVIGGTVQALQSPAKGDKAVADLPEGAVLSNLGCQEQDGALWCEVRPFRGGATGFVPANRLQAAVGPDGSVPVGVDDSKRRAKRRDFDASGTIPCAQVKGQSLGKCRIAVARGGGGDATAVATFSNGFARQLYFTHGEFIRANATMSGVGIDVDWQIDNDIYAIRVDDQRFEIPVDLIIGK